MRSPRTKLPRQAEADLRSSSSDLAVRKWSGRRRDSWLKRIAEEAWKPYWWRKARQEVGEGLGGAVGRPRAIGVSSYCGSCAGAPKISAEAAKRKRALGAPAEGPRGGAASAAAHAECRRGPPTRPARTRRGEVVGLVRPSSRNAARRPRWILELKHSIRSRSPSGGLERSAENVIAMPEQQLSEVGPVLPPDPGDQRAPRHRAASLPLPVAVIGAGNMGRHHARNYDEFADVELRAVVDVDLTRRGPGRRHGCRAFASVEELLAEEPESPPRRSSRRPGTTSRPRRRSSPQASTCSSRSRSPRRSRRPTG